MAHPDHSLSFDALGGQRRAKTFLKRIIASRRLAHAYLFRGPDGVGKQLLAGLFAAWLHCLQPTEAGACGACPSCRKHRSGNHPDIRIVSPENGTIRIDRVRELCRSLSYPPYESSLRVVIIEDIHTMRPEAANSLLKTLEEPPEGNVMILTTESSRAVLPTIVSRCQVIPFHELSIKQTVEVLTSVQPDLEVEEAELLAGLSDGSPGKALLLRERSLVDLRNRIWELLTAAGDDRGDAVEDLLRLAEHMATLKDDLVPLLSLIRMWVRDTMAATAWSGGGTARGYQLRLAALDRAERQLARNCNRTLVCEVLLFDLQSPAPRLSL